MTGLFQEIIDDIKIIIGFIGVCLLGVLALSSFISKNGNTVSVDATVVQAINYEQYGYVSKDLEYKSDLILSYNIANKSYKTRTTEPSTYLKGDTLKIYVDKNKPTELRGSSPYIDLLVSILFFIIAIGILCMSDAFREVINILIDKLSKKDKNNRLYTEVSNEEEHKKINRKRHYYILSAFISFVIAIVFIIFSIDLVKEYVYSFQKDNCIKEVTVVEKLDNSDVVSWIDDNNIEHLQYSSKDGYEIGDTYDMSVVTDTDKSRTVSAQREFMHVFVSIIIDVGLIGTFFWCIHKIKKLKYV